jgi:hypothetical protein
MKRTALSFFLTVLLAWPAELPVTQVVLYKHGVGFFERSGTLAPGESARLDFDASEMNDVLKSLTISDQGGKITGLRYDSMDPLGHTLQQFPFRIGDAQPLSAMLDQLHGARLELKFGNDTVSGVVVNGRMVPATYNQAEREQLTLLLDSGDLRTVDLSAASAIRFPDTQLQRQFKDYLAAVAAARSKEKRSVYIDSSDAKERRVMASYMVPAPVWKSSYRLIFGAAGQPTLEGWAIVDNTSNEDWTKVQLSLVSGRPISFVSQLYQPKYLNRPEVDLPDDAAARPVVHAGAYVANAGKLALPAPPSVPALMAEAGPNGAIVASGSVRGSFDQRDEGDRFQAVAPSTVVNSAAAGALGELFEYRISQPVTIRKNESALLPFLQQAIAARKLLIYSDHSSQHPTNAAELTNSTGKTLDGGPITVYDAGAYGGEALMETLKTGDKRLISYAVDLGTRITEAFGSKGEIVREIHANRGIFISKLAAEEIRTYTARNVDQKAKTLIIEHPLRPGYTLLSQKPEEKTASAYRFELTLPAGETQTFPVSEERIYDQSYSVVNMTPDMLLAYVRNRALSDNGRRQLQKVADQKSLVADNNQAIQDATKQVHDLTADEDRIRQNIQSLGSVSGQQQQVQNYARQLDSHEQQIAAQRDRQAELQKKKTALEGELNKLIEGMSF